MRFYNLVMHLIFLTNICLQIGVVVDHPIQAKRGRDQKPSSWASQLYAPQLEGFERLSAVVVKFSSSILQKLTKLLIIIPQNKCNCNHKDPRHWILFIFNHKQD